MFIDMQYHKVFSLAHSASQIILHPTKALNDLSEKSSSSFALNSSHKFATSKCRKGNGLCGESGMSGRVYVARNTSGEIICTCHGCILIVNLIRDTFSRASGSTNSGG